MRVIVTGTGDAFSTKRFGSSALVETPCGYVAIDCPAAPLVMYRKAAERTGIDIDPGRIHDILMTHLHVDHAGGLETLAFYRRYKASNVEVPGLWATREVMDRCWERLAPSMDGRLFGETPSSSLEDYFNPGLLHVDSANEVGGLTVHVRWGLHAVPTVGMLISDGTSTLGWSGDTEFHLEHAQWLSQADLVVHECGESAKHATWKQLSTLPEDLQKRTKLIHVPDEIELPVGHMKRLEDGEVLEIGSVVGKSA